MAAIGVGRGRCRGGLHRGRIERTRRLSVRARPRFGPAGRFCQNPAVPRARPPSRPRPAAAPPGRHDGDERVDTWFWLRERDDPEVLAYLEAENAYTDGRPRTGSRRCGARLFDEIVGPDPGDRRLGAGAATDPSSTTRRTIEGQQYAVHCRRPAGGRAPDPLAPPGSDPGETVVLDENELAAGHDYFAVGDLAVDPDQRRRRRTRIDTTAASASRSVPRPARRPRPGPTTSRGHVYYGARLGRRRPAPSSTSGPTTRCAPTRSGATPSAPPAADDVLVFAGGRRAVLRRRRPDPQRSVRRDLDGLEAHQRGVAASPRPTPDAHRRDRRRRARTATSTTSSTTSARGATGSSSSPTPAAPRTSR